MPMHTIEVDDKIWNYLKKFAEPLEDTPNSVLNRLLFGDTKSPRLEPMAPLSVQGLPKALAQILEVLYEIRVNGYTRLQATRHVAAKRGTSPQTVIDKYCRQLKKRASEIDRLLNEPGLSEFKALLTSKFRQHREIIEVFFDSMAAKSEPTNQENKIDIENLLADSSS